MKNKKKRIFKREWHFFFHSRIINSARERCAQKRLELSQRVVYRDSDRARRGSLFISAGSRTIRRRSRYMPRRPATECYIPLACVYIRIYMRAVYTRRLRRRGIERESLNFETEGDLHNSDVALAKCAHRRRRRARVCFIHIFGGIYNHCCCARGTWNLIAYILLYIGRLGTCALATRVAERVEFNKKNMLIFLLHKKKEKIYS